MVDIGNLGYIKIENILVIIRKEETKVAFSNTSYSETVTSLLGDMQKFVKNDYYKFSDKPPTPVEYYHINKDASTIDEGSRLAFADVGKDSPLRFNLVHNFMLYGIETPISVTYQNDEYGLESSSIEGDAYILPNTIRPFPGDIFVISYLKETLLFTVTDSSPDTLETGANMWKITYKSRPTSSAELRQLFYQVVGEYNFIIDNIGTEYNCILKTDVVDFIKLVDEEIRKLKMFFKRIFYNKRVQTFIYSYCEQRFYDPYMIEFLRRNKVLEGDDQYIYVGHQTELDPLFPMLYNNTIFRCLEKKDPQHIRGYIHRGVGKLITGDFNIFSNRIEDYWEVYYDYEPGFEALKKIPCFMDEFIAHAEDGETLESNITFYNIIIKYLYGDSIDITDIDEIDKIEYQNNSILFYALPCIIFCLEKSVQDLVQIKDDADNILNKEEGLCCQ